MNYEVCWYGSISIETLFTHIKADNITNINLTRIEADTLFILLTWSAKFIINSKIFLYGIHSF